MKKSVLIIGILSFIFLFSLFTFHCSAQNWKWLNPLPTGNYLYDVKFVNTDTGWAVGSFGTIVSTIDGGENWTLQKSGKNNRLNSLCFTNPTTLYAVGDTGIIIKSTNGGNQWFRQIDSIYDDLISVCFPNANIGYAISGLNGIVLKTIDAGNNWIEVSEIYPPGGLSSAYFTDSINGFIVGDYGWILQTTDGGYDWSLKETPVIYGTSSDDVGLYSVVFPDKRTGYIMGYDPETFVSILLKSTNGGNDWKIQFTDSIFSPFYVYFTDSLMGYALCLDGGIMKTINGGKSWIIQDSIKAGYAIYFVDANVGYTVGNYQINKTINSGNKWTSQFKTITLQNLNSLFTTDTNTIYIVGDSGTIIKTTDGGITFIKQKSGTWKSFNSVYFIDKNTGYIAGDYNAILKTTDAGNNWVPLNINYSANYVSILFTSIDTGYVVCNKNGSSVAVIYKTNDGGNTWYGIYVGVNLYLSNIYFINSQVGFASGADNKGGVILKTLNGGKNWQDFNINSEDLLALYFINSELGYIVGDYCYLFKTTDEGNTWVYQYIKNPTNFTNSPTLNSINFINDSIGYMVGEYGTIFKSTNEGNSWIHQNNFTYNTFNSILFTNAQSGYIIGEKGTILKSSIGASVITGVDKSIVKSPMFKGQCYPNPANSLIVVSYSLLEQNSVNIILYDITGRKVADIINEIQTMGEHSIKYNIANLKSGIYIIKIVDAQTVRIVKFIKE